MTTWWAGKRKQPIGAKKRANSQSEAAYARAFEATLQLHRLEFWHCTVAQRSQPGFPDYTICGDGWLGFVELKAVSLLTGRRGKVSEEQRRWQRAIEQGGGEWRTFCLPDDWEEVDEWLNGHTGKNIWDSRSRHVVEVKQ